MRNFATLTLAHAQRTQPWTIPYSPALNAAQAEPGTAHLLGSHAALHAAKTVGQICAVFETLDHTGAGITPEQVKSLADKSADLVTAALRMANLYGFCLAEALVERSEDKNQVKLPSWDSENVAVTQSMVDRFLSWRLPNNFSPDAGISFTPKFNNGTAEGGTHRPTGTNLLNNTQAEDMLRHVLAPATDPA